MSPTKKSKMKSMAELLRGVPDTGFSHGAKSNADAEYVAEHPEQWEPIVLLSKGRPKKGKKQGFTQKTLRIPDDMMELIEAKAKEENLIVHAAMRKALLDWAQNRLVRRIEIPTTSNQQITQNTIAIVNDEVFQDPDNQTPYFNLFSTTGTMIQRKTK